MSNAATTLPAVAALPAPRAQVALTVATGASITEAAQRAGVHRSTVYDWIRSDPAFSAAVDEARQDYIGLLRDQLRSLSVKALNRLEALLDDPATPAAVALRAALAVLNRPRFPDPGWTLPESVGERDWLVCPEARSAEWTSLPAEARKAKEGPVLLRQQQDTPTENDALLEADYKALCQRERLKRASAESCSPDKSRHNPTQIAVLSPPPAGDPMPASLSASAPLRESLSASSASWREPVSANARGRCEEPAPASASTPSPDKSRHNPTQIAVLSPPLAGDPVPASLSASAPLREPISGRPSRNAPCPCGSPAGPARDAGVAGRSPGGVRVARCG